MNSIQETPTMVTPTHAKKPVQRGNTSGLIGLWNSRVIPGEDSLSDDLGSGSVDRNKSDLLQIRERAMRRISVRDPPSPASLEANRRKPYMPQTLSAPKSTGPSSSMLGDSLRVDPNLKTRKTSELVRPTFSILKDISEERGLFAGGILHERPHSAAREKVLPTVIIENKALTDDSIQRANTPRRGSGAGLGRSKSVKINRVKFGLMLDATEGVTRPNPVLGESDGNSPLQNLQGLQGEVQQIPSQGRPRMAATPNGSRLTRQASMPLSSFTGQQTYSFNRPPQPAIGNAPGGSAGNGGQTGSRPSIARSATSAKETILTWVQQQVNHYNNVNVTNFSTCWNDGLAFCALIHNFYPEAFDFSKLESRNRRYNFKLAFDVAEKYGDVCPLLDVDDMVKMTKPDWKCVFTYVQSFYRRFRNGREKVSPKRTLVLQRSPDREDPANVSALEMSIPWRGPAYSKTEFVLNPKPTLQPFEKFKNFQVPSLPKTDFKAATAAKVQSPMLSLSPKQSTNNFYQFSNTTPCNQLTRQQKSLLLQRQSSLPQSSTLQQQPPSVKHVRLQTSENQAQFQSHLSRNLSLISFISQRATNPSPPCSPLPALTPPLSQQRQHPTPIQPNNKALDSIGHAPFQRQPNHQGSEPSKRSKHFGGTTTFSRQRSTSPSTISFGSQSLRSSRQMSLPPMPKLAPPPPPPFL